MASENRDSRHSLRDFDLDLPTGQIAEETLRRLLTYRAPGGRVFIEVKNNCKVKGTGNLFIEYEDRGRPSGLATTKAEWYAFTSEEHGQDVFMLLRVPWLKKRLKHLLDTGKARKASGGDKGQARGVLVRPQDLWSDKGGI